jgi:hypothetical protein
MIEISLYRDVPRRLLGFERSTLRCMPYIVWVYENDQPRVLDIKYELLDSTDPAQRHTYEQFKKIVGKAKAEAAIRRYLRAQDAA